MSTSRRVVLNKKSVLSAKIEMDDNDEERKSDDGDEDKTNNIDEPELAVDAEEEANNILHPNE
jgi:hypothetical protein